MPRFTFLLLSIFALHLSVAAQLSARDEKTVEETFASGGDIQLRLGADDYKIVPSDRNVIVVSWYASKNRDDKVRVSISTSGSKATVQTRFPRSFRNRPTLTIQIPLRSNLKVRLSAGDLTVGPVEGNLDVEVHAGDLRLDVLSPEQFGSVDASTRIGDLDSGPFTQQQKGWLGHGIKWQGAGAYRLHAHVGTGDLVIAAAP